MTRDREPLQRRFGGVVFDGSPPRADHLICEPIQDSQKSGLRYSIDERFSGDVLVDWGAVGGLPDDRAISALNAALLSMVAQHTLPEAISARIPLPQDVESPFRLLLSMLYDIRSSCDETPFRTAPLLKAESGLNAHRAPASVDPQRILLLLSGGFDSTFAAILLKEAGYTVEALHVRTNKHVEASEEAAARHVAAYLDIPLHIVPLRFLDQERVGRYYSRSFGQYPFYNSVPHGRDFPLAVIGAIVARRLGCDSVAFGHEKESRQKVIPDRGRQIYRHDVESAYGRRLVQLYLDAALSAGTSLFSPIAGMSIYSVRKALITRFPQLVPAIRSCFWSIQCDKCLKCLSTYTLQRHLDVALVPFMHNPFSDKDDEDMRLFAAPDRPSPVLGYGPLMHYAMAKIIDDGYVRPEDHWLLIFQEHALTSIRQQWGTIENICLSVDQAPEVPPRIHACLEQLQ